MHVQSLSVSKDFQFFFQQVEKLSTFLLQILESQMASTECSIDKINRTCKSYQQPSEKNVPQYIHMKMEAGC